MYAEFLRLRASGINAPRIREQLGIGMREWLQLRRDNPDWWAAFCELAAEMRSREDRVPPAVRQPEITAEAYAVPLNPRWQPGGVRGAARYVEDGVATGGVPRDPWVPPRRLPWEDGW